jgi:predicted phosphodiesterase
VRHPFDLPSDFPYARLGRDYASGDYTIDEICAEYDIPRDVFMAIRRAAPKRWTKRGPNLWWDDLEDEESELAQRAADEQKAARVGRKAKRREQREMERAAENWWQFESTVDEAAERFTGWAERYSPPRLRLRVGPQRALEPATLILPIHDLHYGKYAAEDECGARYDRAVAARRATEAVEFVLEQAARTARIERIITVCGTSDYLHVDRDMGGPQTTSGTPQDTDGTMAEIMEGGQRLAVQLIDRMRSLAPTRVVYCPGNHDYHASQWMHAFLKSWYRQTDAVTFSEGYRTRNYFTYGVTKGVFFHGDVRKGQLKELGNTIAREHGFGQYTMAISGHKHFRQADDKSGLLMHQCLSLSGSDRWHDKNLYTGLPGLQAFVLDRERGPIATPTWYV